MRSLSVGAIVVMAFVVVTTGRTAMANKMKAVGLLSADGKLTGAAFSPDNSRIAVIRNVVDPKIGQQHILEIVELRSGRKLDHADVLIDGAADLATNAHLLGYSSDGRYLLLATRGSDVLRIIDATTLHSLQRIVLHPDARTSLGQGHRYFRGIVSLSVSAEGNVFAVLSHDEMQGNELFIGSFSLGRIVNSWSLGRGRIATQLGQVSLSLSEDGSTVAVTLLPDENKLPKDFKNVRLFSSTSGELLKSVRTDGLVGQLALLPNGEVLAARIDTPGLFSKKACLEQWDLNTGKLERQFCDADRTVGVALSASPAAGNVVGFGFKAHRSIEGQVYSVSGRIDVWNMSSGALVASSDEMPHSVSSVQISTNGQLVLADQELLQLSATP